MEAVIEALKKAGMTLTPEHLWFAKRGCEAGIPVEMTASHLKLRNQWFVLEAVSARLGRRLSTEEIDQVIALYVSGATVESIAYGNTE
jgi:hypothetical protein